MGRAFEYRRARKEKRWDKMSKAFTRLGKEIAISVKQGGTDPMTNPRLRMAIQNAKGVNMPKDRIEAAIKRASSKDEKDFEEIVYEGYGPHGVAILAECATDNATRTVANIRMYFTRAGGTLGKTGSLDFIFERKGEFILDAAGLSVEDLELELIDFGAEEVFESEGEIYVYTSFTDFGGMQKALEEKGYKMISSAAKRFPSNTTKLEGEAYEELLKLIERFEEDDDIQAVYHTLEMHDEE